jgi:hypothetical protein
VEEKMTHADFDLLYDETKKGKGELYIPTAYRCTKIDNKCILKFESANAVVIKKSNDGKGFRVARGRGFDYVLPDYLVYREYK